VPAPLLHAMTCGRVRRWMTCVLHTVSDSGSGHAHTEGFCAFRLVGTRRSFRTSGVHHREEVRATNWGNGVYVGAQANGARTIKERSVGHSWRRTSASSITTDRPMAEFGRHEPFHPFQVSVWLERKHIRRVTSKCLQWVASGLFLIRHSARHSDILPAGRSDACGGFRGVLCLTGISH
jgi:hypothetical protein